MLKLVVLSVFLLTVCVYCEDEVVKEVEDKIDGDDDVSYLVISTLLAVLKEF